MCALVPNPVWALSSPVNKLTKTLLSRRAPSSAILCLPPVLSTYSSTLLSREAITGRVVMHKLLHALASTAALFCLLGGRGSSPSMARGSRGSGAQKYRLNPFFFRGKTLRDRSKR